MIGCKSLSNLVELVETNVNLERKLEKFQKLLKGIKLWSIKILNKKIVTTYKFSFICSDL
jgi:hypothetical protein